MGDEYDLSELPTVVYHGEKPVVYDGNRRVLLGKIYNKLISHELINSWGIPIFPNKIPCNVCDEATALKNVLRKHADSGSWGVLERDIFLHKHMGEKKSALLLFDEATGLITKHDYWNQRFIKEEVLTNEKLNKLGFNLTDDKLETRYGLEKSKGILENLSEKIKDKTLSTRNSRGKVYEVLDPAIRELIDSHKGEKYKPFTAAPDSLEEKSDTPSPRRTKRQTNKKTEFFGEKLYLQNGDVNDLYMDICNLYEFFHTKNGLSLSFASLIRMSLRLLCETASSSTLDDYIKSHFNTAKQNLNQDDKTTLSTQNVTDNNLTRLLHIGAHNYKASKNMEQTFAISVILGAMLKISHGKE